MPTAPNQPDANSAHLVLTGMLEACRHTVNKGGTLDQFMQMVFVNFGAIDQAAREGGRLPNAWHAKPGMQIDHPHMTALAIAGDRVISEENRNILKGKADSLRSAIEAWKQLKREGDNPRGIHEELERVADEASNLAKRIQIVGVADGLFEGWEI
ncbi:hypothetical protein [Streptomyces sp. NPDC096311]|uniref:hypothetical protein n=1 Tax=Streptomyces sp. NPDC096311 TaxID=3366083 RepID=UPI003829590B